MNNLSQGPFKVSQDLTVHMPQSSGTYAIFIEEWNSIMKQLGRVTDYSVFFHSCAFTFFGVGASTLTSVLCKFIPNNISAPYLVIVFVGILGFICLWEAERERKRKKILLSDIISSMKYIQNRYQIDPKTTVHGMSQAGNEMPLNINTLQGMLAHFFNDLPEDEALVQKLLGKFQKTGITYRDIFSTIQELIIRYEGNFIKDYKEWLDETRKNSRFTQGNALGLAMDLHNNKFWKVRVGEISANYRNKVQSMRSKINN